MVDPTPARALSYSAVWDDAGRMLRANGGMLTAIAGVFMLLPAMLIARYAPPPAGAVDSLQEWGAELSLYLRANWPWQLVSMVAGAVGVVAIYLLLLGGPRLTVAAALRRAVALVPGYFTVSVIAMLAIFCGTLLLVLPGIFLFGRLMLASPAVVVDTPNAPFAALQRSWEMSRARGWSIAGLLVIVSLVGLVATAAVERGVGTLILLLAGSDGVALLLLAFLDGLMTAAFSLLITVVVAATYRAAQRRP